MTHSPYDKHWFYSQEQLPVEGAANGKHHRFYQLKNTHQIVMEVNLPAGKKDCPAELAVVADVHLNYCIDEDQQDPEIAHTRTCRHWLASGVALLSLVRTLDAIQYSDKSVFVGDILDYMSQGAEMLVKKYLFDGRHSVVAAIGGHDMKKQLQTGLPEQTPLEERLAHLQTFWPNPIHYHAEKLDNGVTLVLLDNSQGRYLPLQAQRLREDVEEARRNGNHILVFQHEPISTGRAEDVTQQPILAFSKEPYNFYDGNICCSPLKLEKDENSATVYKIICENADVIKGIFCGHTHEAYYTEIRAVDRGEEATIPQYVCPANPYRGQVGIYMRLLLTGAP